MVPDVAKVVQVDSVLGDELPTQETIKKLNYTKAVLEEALRLEPPVALIDRVNLKDGLNFLWYFAETSVQIAGHTIPKDTVCCVFMQALHLSPEHWNNPKKFDPSRWIHKEENKVNNWTFLPFIAGIWDKWIEINDN